MSGDFYYLGKITKVFGLKGELSVYLDTDEPEKYYQLESVFLTQGEELIPFFTESVKVKGRSQLVVKFRDIEAAEAASYVDEELYLPVSMLLPLTGNRFYYHEIKGFSVEEETYGKLGVCVDVIEYPHQALFQIDAAGKEVLVPIVDDFIRMVDREQRKLTLSLPEGLLEIYLNPEPNNK